MDITTDSILFLFLFILPGAFSKLLQQRFAPYKRFENADNNSWVELCEMIVFSSIVLLTNIVIVKFKYKNITITNNYIKLILDTDFLIRYIIFTLIITAIYTFIFNKMNKGIIVNIVNWYNKKNNKPLESPYQSIWETIFETKKYFDFSKEDIVVSIEKDGKVISRGFIELFPAPQTNCSDIALKYCAEVEGYFKYDNTVTDDKKIFNKTVLEYCNMEQGIIIKFYDMEKYNNYILGYQKNS